MQMRETRVCTFLSIHGDKEAGVEQISFLLSLVSQCGISWEIRPRRNDVFAAAPNAGPGSIFTVVASYVEQSLLQCLQSLLRARRLATP